MTTKELITDILAEYAARIENGEPYYQIWDYRAFLYVNKHLSKEQKAIFCKEATWSSFKYLQSERDRVFEKNLQVDREFIYALTEKIFPFQILFQICSPFAATDFEEEEIFSLLDYYTPEHIIKVTGEYDRRYHDLDLSDQLLSHKHVLELISHYNQHYPLSNRITNTLEKLKGSLAFEQSQVEKRDAWYYGFDHTYYRWPESPLLQAGSIVAELSAMDMASGKKWKWLSERDLPFIAEKERFYTLIEDLSKINFFLNHEISPEIKDTIRLIQPAAFEVFILDLYDESIKAGNTRGPWFLTGRVAALQIFVWIIHYLGTPNQFTILSKFAEKCFTKIPKVGPTSRKLGDIILKILSESETVEGLGVLLNLKARAKYPVFREALDNATRKAINYTQLNPNEVEDYFINDFGLKEGKVEVLFSDFRSEIEVESYKNIQLRWFKPDGKLQKSVPSKVKTAFPSELKLWKAQHKDIKKELSGQRQRIEGFWRKKKRWSFDKWQTYFLNHELLRHLSRFLIWQFEFEQETFSAIWREGVLVDATGSAVTGSMVDSTVSLWHPSSATVEEVQAWRNFILTHEIKQPFKQAFREIYLVTDAEISTSTYSNRFTNHIVRHHKFAALAKQRIWVYANVYSEDPPYIEYPDFKIQATFDVMSHYDLATTGRLHFRDLQNNKALQMEEVPTLIFSETMRDVDLFVGVCSIGIEEEYHLEQHRNYWRNYSTSDLSETGKTRRMVLENMLPKLKINDQCELTDRYLRVQGKVRTYKIHLGSGNILMEPNDEYLCIVPDRSKKSKAHHVFLPFDDDVVFSVILSKAFLLADDDQIEDTVILNQIHR